MQKATYVHTVGILKVVKETFGHPPLLRLESCIPWPWWFMVTMSYFCFQIRSQGHLLFFGFHDFPQNVKENSAA